MVVGLVIPRVHEVNTETYDGYLERHRVDPHSWFLSTIADQLHREDAADGFVLVGRGTPIRVVEPGHPFGEYLELRNGYEARITDVIRAYSNAVVLAENRGGDPIAAEFRIGSGSLILLPPPQTPEEEQALSAAVEDSLALSVRPRAWTVREEREIAEALDQRLAAMRTARDAAGKSLREIRSLKDQVLQESIVRRALGYWERAIRPGTRLDTAFHELYRLIEMLEDHYRGGERELADALGIPLTRIKSVKRLANQKEHDFRHATVGDPAQPQTQDVQEAFVTAGEIVQAFVEARYASLKSERSPQAVPHE